MATKPTQSKPQPASSAHSATVGAWLKQRREQLGMTLGEIEIATRIRGKYLRQIEADDYSQLANDIYTRGFVQTYARRLGLDVKEVLRRYEVQRGGQPESPRRLQPVVRTGATVLPRVLLGLLGLVVVVAIAGYLSVQLGSLTTSPRLNVTAPAGDQSVYGGVIDIAGDVAGGADVTVNDSPLLTDSNGHFIDKLALQNGVNSIRIVAKNRLGASTTVTRNILAQVPQATSESVVPGAPFDGVAVAIGIADHATAVTVRVDGKEVFRGTMLPGTSQTFKGATKVSVTTADAGVTSATVTNTLVANRVINPLGPKGERRQDLEFAKDTNFQ